MITPRIAKAAGALLTKIDDHAPRNKTIGALLTKIDDHAPRNENYRGFIDHN